MENSVVEMIVSLIGSLGFPIVCCFFLWKYINNTMKEFTAAMSDNTRMLNKICDKLDMWKTEKGETESE